MDKVRVGIIGCGWQAERGHIRAYGRVEGAEIVALADVAPERLRLVGEAIGLPPKDWHNDYHALLARDDVELVSIATPPVSHHEIVLAAAAAGKHVVCEKPLARTVTEVDEMIAACREAGVEFGTYHNYFYRRELMEARQLLDEGRIGTPTGVIIDSLGIEPWPGAAEFRPNWRWDPAYSGGGLIMDAGIHAFYLPEWLMRQEATAITARVDRLILDDVPSEDAAFTQFHFPRGYAQLNLTVGKGPASLVIVGSEGNIVLRYDNRWGWIASPTTSVAIWRNGEEVEKRTYEFHRALFGPGQIEDIVAHVRDPQHPWVSAEVGRRALELVMAMYESGAREATVPLPMSANNPFYRKGVFAAAEANLPASHPWRQKKLFGLA